MALYIYGLMRTEDARAVLAAGSDQSRASSSDRGPAELEAVAHDGVSALVSPISDGTPRLKRESALAHNETLQAAFAHGPVLPVRFGTVLADADSLEREFLAPRSAELRARLEALQGVAEMQVRATYLEEPLLRSVLGSSPDLAQAAARIQSLPPAASHFDRINLGEAIHRVVEARRRQDAATLVDELRPLAESVRVRDPRHEREVVNASFLVAQERLEAFDALVERQSAEGAGEMVFKLIGPMPAHSFAMEPVPIAASGGSSWA